MKKTTTVVAAKNAKDAQTVTKVLPTAAVKAVKAAKAAKDAQTVTPKVEAKIAYRLTAKQLSKMEKCLGLSDSSDEDFEMDEESITGKIDSILKLFTAGFSKKDIIAFGFNKTTVYIQTRELTKRTKLPDLYYHGHELYEKQLREQVAALKATREKVLKEGFEPTVINS